MFGPGSEFGFENPLQFFRLPPAGSEIDLIRVLHTLGFGYPGLRCQKNLLFFIQLLSEFGPLPSPHNRQVAGLGGPVEPCWAHYSIDFYGFL